MKIVKHLYLHSYLAVAKEYYKYIFENIKVYFGKCYNYLTDILGMK